MSSGTWGGTMCLTEPHAGSDVGASRTTATKQADGRYLIRGTKIFISGGDHDLADNIVHLALARVEGAPPGTKGLSLFIIPKIRINEGGSLGERNDVLVGPIEHKMGINGSSTCVLNFGESDGCLGELVGTVENQGMPQMFRMMNGARISVGVQGVAVASTAYLNALDYAKDRKQGPNYTQWKDPTAPRVAIIRHPDVRRMLLDMKARVEGIRALIVKLARHQDAVTVFQGKDDQKAAYHQGQVDLLVPLVKAYGSDQAFRVCETAIQTYGGAGYTKDYPVEQYCRDSKIFSIYEGTNHIQAMDLVGRKLGQAGGQNLQAFLGDVAGFCKANEKHAILGPLVKELEGAHEAVAGSAMRLLSWSHQARGPHPPRGQPLPRDDERGRGGVAAPRGRQDRTRQGRDAARGRRRRQDRAFYAGKHQAAAYFARSVLPKVKLDAEIMGREDSSPLDISDEAFATV